MPEERKRDGIIPQRSVANNIALPSMARFAPRGFIRRRALRKEATEILRNINLRPLQIDRPIRLFSGGNQQKAIIARWIAAGRQILLFDEPTRGIDIGAKAEIYTLIERLAAEGKSVIVVSSELPEIIRLADRVLVMRQGRIAAELRREELSEQAIVAHAVPQPPSTDRTQRGNPGRETMTIANPTVLPSAHPAGPPGQHQGFWDPARASFLIVVVFALVAPGFLAERNLLNILQQSSINACVALG